MLNHEFLSEHSDDAGVFEHYGGQYNICNYIFYLLIIPITVKSSMLYCKMWLPCLSNEG